MTVILPESTQERNNLRDKHKNQKVTIPNLLSFLPGWRCEVNPYLHAADKDFHAWLNSLDVPEKFKIVLGKGNYVLMLAVFFPETTQEKLLVLSKFICWWGIWDDEVDPGGQLANDRKGSLDSCEQLRKCIEDCLSPSPNFTPTPETRESVKMAYPILAEMREHMGLVSADNLRRTFLDWIDSVVEKQSCQIGQILDPWDYFRLRTMNVGVIQTSVLQEYALGYELPRWVHEHDAVKAVSQECANLGGLVNDILSLQKEFCDEQVENIVLLFAHHYDLDIEGAISKAYETIQEHFALCTAAEARLPIPTGDAKLDADILKYVEGCKDVVVGTVYWAYYCERYFKKSQVNDDLELQLDLFVD
ncbi:pentalenene synthase [Penicillium angulare]|uniref:Terpene synthase n=1 Tax=Penicillium angulare TaxID=116970 RepID=A0A9W9KKB5_9EURO|nr:pentalenene synthase [Penicillium angulare]